MDIDVEREAGRTVRVRLAGATDGPLIVYRGHLVVFHDWDLVLDDLGFS